MRKPPGRALLWVVCLLLFFIGFEMSGFQLALRSVSAEFGMNTTGSGLLVASQSTGVVLMPLVFGSLSDRLGKRRMLMIFALVFFCGCALAATGREVWLFASGVFLIGSGFSVCECVATAALGEEYPEKSGAYITLSQCVLSFGAVAGPLICSWGTAAFSWDWRAAFAICGGGCLVVFLLLWVVRFGRLIPEAEKSPKPGMRGLFASRVFSLLFVAVLCYVGLENGIGYFSETLFYGKLQSASLGAYAISTYWACMALSRLVCSFSPLSPRKTLLISLGTSVILFTVLAVSGTPLLSLIVCGLIGFAFGPVWALIVDLAAGQFPGHTGAALGMMSAGCGLGGALFPALMGVIADSFSLEISFLLLAAAALAAGGLCFAAVRKT